MNSIIKDEQLFSRFNQDDNNFGGYFRIYKHDTGFMMIWCYFTILKTETTYTITFPIEFASAPLCITDQSADDLGRVFCSVGETNQCTVVWRNRWDDPDLEYASESRTLCAIGRWK